MEETIQLHEALELAPGFVLDEEAGTLKGVIVLGAESKNHLVFPEHVRREALQLMEGAFVNWNHRPKGATEVPLENRFGCLSNFRDDGSVTRADLLYLKEHVHAKQFISIVKTNPKMCGFSILGDATKGGKDAQGRTIVGKITKVHSFDLVSDTGSGFGLRESEEQPEADYEASGCLKAIMELCNGEGTDREKLEKIKSHIEALEGGEEEVEESLKQTCVALCESHKVKATDELVNILMNVPVDHREKIVKKRALVKAPKSGAPANLEVRESAPQPSETEEQAMERIASLFKGR